MTTLSILHLAGVLIVGIAIGLYVARLLAIKENFQGYVDKCESCGGDSPCNCPKPKPRPICPACPECKQPDMSKYVLKSSIPPCPAVPDMSNYILKSECPPVPDLSNYVLKSSVPKQQPVILDCSKCNKPKGECPPCPRPRCPEVQCPPQQKCPSCPPCPRQSCPPAVVKCKAEEPANMMPVRPYMAPLDYNMFGRD